MRLSARRLGLLLAVPLTYLAATLPPPAYVPVYLQKPISTEYSPLSAAVVDGLNLKDIEDYGPYAVGWIAPADSSAFSDRAAAFSLAGRLAPEYSEIRFRDYRIVGTDSEAPDLPSDLRLDDYKGNVGLYVVQFRSQVRDEWLAKLAGAGGRTIHYLPENSYLVAATPSTVPGFADLPGMRHTIVYQPAYKLEASLSSHPDAQRVLVQLDPGQDTADVLQIISGSSKDPITTQELGPYVDVEATLDLQVIKTLALSPATIWIEPVTGASPSDERSAQIVAGNHGSSQATGAGTYRSTYLPGICSGCLLDSTMQTYVVNVMDTGLDKGVGQAVHADLTGRILGFQDYYDPTFCSQSGTCGASRPTHGELVAGIIAADPPSGTGGLLRDDLNFYWGTGVSPRAKLRISRIFGPFFEPMPNLGASSVTTITRDAYNAGARFQNQSWNTGDSHVAPSLAYDALAQAVDFLVRDAYGSWSAIRPMFISISAGNYPYLVPPAGCPSCVASPATAKNAVTMGASTEQRVGGNCGAASRPLTTLALLSTRRSWFDTNRIKPDFVAPATRIVAQQTTNSSPTYYGGCPADASTLVAGTNNAYAYSAGTSFAAPHASAVATLFSRYYRKQYGGGSVDPTPAMLRAMMVVGAEEMHGGTDDQTGQTIGWVPAYASGFGRLGMKNIFAASPSSKVGDEDHGATPVRRLVPSQTVLTWTMTVADPTKEIRIAMAYTDYPAAINAGRTAVNSVQLYALQGGYVYCDGQPPDSQGYSFRSTGCAFPDLDNSIKFLRIAPNSFTGTFQVQVVGTLNAKGVPGLDGTSNNQDMAVWVWNAY